MDNTSTQQFLPTGASLSQSHYPSSRAENQVEKLASRLWKSDDRWCAHYKELNLISLLQPIVSHSHQKNVGVEALVRGLRADGTSEMPAEMFQEPDTRLLESLSRLLHLANFKLLSDFSGWLFINISPALVAHDDDPDDLAAALAWAGVEPKQVVIELTEQACYQPNNLVDAVERYRQLGCKIAIDDFGAGHSNFERIWSLRPDIVKLDRNMVLRANADACIEQMLPRLVELIHQAGALVLAEGVETPEQALMVWNSGADLGQGYLFGYPRQQLPCADSLAEQLNSLASSSQQQWQRDWQRRRKLYDSFYQHIKQAMSAIEQDAPLAQAAATLLENDRVRRCFLLDDQGVQLESVAAAGLDKQQTPLSEEAACHWGRRSYFRNAIECPKRLHVSFPYLSVTDGTVCQTLSVSFEKAGNLLVFCCDVEPE